MHYDIAACKLDYETSCELAICHNRFINKMIFWQRRGKKPLGGEIQMNESNEPLSLFSGQYLLRGITPNFSTGRRKNLRYALPTHFHKYVQINPNGPEPAEYLEFAKEDLLSRDLRGALNCLGNAKKSVHLIVDSYLTIIGIGHLYLKKRFPEKLEIIKKLGIFPTKLVSNLNKKRNVVEHEYKNIEISEAEEFLDLAEMLVLLAYPYLKAAVAGALVGVDGEDRCIELRLIENSIEVSEIINQRSLLTEIGKIYFNIEEAKKNTRVIEKIEIKIQNEEKWLPTLDLFVHCTISEALRLEKDPWKEGNQIIGSEVYGKNFLLDEFEKKQKKDNH